MMDGKKVALQCRQTGEDDRLPNECILNNMAELKIAKTRQLLFEEKSILLKYEIIDAAPGGELVPGKLR
jgi:hypothetical protein